MRYASILYRNYRNNSLFLSGPGENNGEFYLPYAKLRERFLASGIELNTPDLNSGRRVEFELHINCRHQKPQSRAFVYLFENPLIRPLNRDLRALSNYARWFTWDSELLNDPRSIRLFYPNKIEVNEGPSAESRDLFCVLVASNKALAVSDERSQYEERVKIINWYEKNAPNDFHLFGAGWDRPAALSGRWGRIYNQIQKCLTRFRPRKSSFKTWRGRIENKMEVLKRARFCIAHENCRDLPGYITEKLFDCFRAGCVPIYIGPKDIHDYVPGECFIDGRQFNNTAELDNFLHSIDDTNYKKYQENIYMFLVSEEAKQFSQDNFVDNIVKHILKHDVLC
jgi:alpha(1,3/1,4) fucosyltransferase